MGGAAALAWRLDAASREALETQWRRIAAATDGTVGAAALHIESGASASLNGDKRFAMMSVCKFPAGAHAFALVDEGKLALDAEIEVVPGDVMRSVSPIGRAWPGRSRYPLVELVAAAIIDSDNTAIETLFRVCGGQAAFAARFKQWGIEGFRVDRGEAEASVARAGVTRYPPRDSWDDRTYERLSASVDDAHRRRAWQAALNDPRDTATPLASVQLLAKLFRGELLSKASTDRLVRILEATTTFPTRIKGLLPEGTVVAHKTGSSGTYAGYTPATNDIGVMRMPDGSHLAVAVYVKGSTRDDATRDRVIARVARAAYDHWLGRA